MPLIMFTILMAFTLIVGLGIDQLSLLEQVILIILQPILLIGTGNWFLSKQEKEKNKILKKIFKEFEENHPELF